MLTATFRILFVTFATVLCQTWLLSPLLGTQSTPAGNPTYDNTPAMAQTPLDTPGPTPEHPVKESDEQTDETRIGILINQLGSAEFTERQYASEQLWNSGPIVIEPLRNALGNSSGHPDSEVAHRIRNILDALELGVDPSTPRSNALMVLFFRDGEHGVREQIIRHLRIQFDYPLIFELLGQLKNPDERRQLYENEIELGKAIHRLAIQGEWDAIREILTHEIAWEFDSQLCIFFAFLHDEFDTKLAALMIQVKEYETGHPVPTAGVAQTQHERNVLLVVKMLRTANRRNEAMTFAEKVSDRSQRQRLKNGMEMEAGQWASVAKRLVSKSEPGAENETAVVASLPQIALAHYFAGNQEEFESTLQKMAETTSQSTPAEDSNRASELVDVLLATLNWDDAKQYLDPEQTGANFQLFAFLQRNEEALQSVGLSDDFAQRLVWFQRLAIQLESIFRQHTRTANVKDIGRRINKQVGLPTLDEETVDARATAVFDLGISAASHLGRLGFTDESRLHLRSIADTITRDNPGSYDKRTEILRLFIDLGAYDDAWKILEERFHESEYADTFRVMFPYKYSSFEFWFKQLSSSRPELLPRAQYVARIINSPLGSRIEPTAEPIELESVFSIVDSLLSSSTTSVRNNAYYQFALTCFFNGDFQNSRHYLEIAARDGNYLAQIRLADLAMESGDNAIALEIYEQLWKKSISSTTTTYSARAAAECFERRGNSERAIQRKLVSYVAWLESYRTDQVLDQFARNKKNAWLENMLNVSVHAAKGSLMTNEYYRYALATSQELGSPQWAVNNRRVYLYNRFGTKDAIENVALANIACQIQLDDALAQLRDKNANRALETLLRFDQFRPGDPELGERLIPEFDRLGESQKADMLFKTVVKYYSSTLSRYPDSPLHHNNYAWFCASCKRGLDEAQFHSDFAVRSRPDNSSYLDTQAELSFLKGDLETAMRLSRKCLQLRPSKRHYQEQFLRFGGGL